MAVSALSSAHRRQLQTLTGLATTRLGQLWVPPADGVVARNQLARILRQLVPVYGAMAATLAADHFDEMREAAGVSGRFRAAPVEIDVESEALDVAARVAVGPLFAAVPDRTAAATLAAGVLQLQVANADRDTMRRASIDDPRSAGWVRVGVGECQWCQGHLDGVVRSDDSFPAHDHCNCTAEPAFE